jgi:hypothetical protein
MEAASEAKLMFWGIFPWSKEDGLQHLHPDHHPTTDLSPFYCRVFKVSEFDQNYLELEGASGRFRVKPDLIQPIDWPRFAFGEEVRTLPPATLRQGRIREIMWHYKERREFYLIEVHGKNVSKRYWAEDLGAVEA